VHEDIRGRLFNQVITYVREHHREDIDLGYTSFWEEEFPEDFLSGTALELAFINFEDWLLCDYRDKDGRALIDTYLEHEDVTEQDRGTLVAMRDSVVSLYEVSSTGDGIVLRDLVLDGEVFTRDSALSNLKPGDVFAARLIPHGDTHVLGRGVYPFHAGARDTLLQYVERQYDRYHRHKNPEGGMRRFLKDEAYLFNIIWVNSLFKLKK
jgi:hypothetical protein